MSTGVVDSRAFQGTAAIGAEAGRLTLAVAIATAVLPAFRSRLNVCVLTGDADAVPILQLADVGLLHFAVEDARVDHCIGMVIKHFEHVSSSAFCLRTIIVPP